MNSNNELIIFIHIAKTGGTTLRDILDKQYGSNSLFMYADPAGETLNNKEKIIKMLLKHINTAKSISGHFSFGMKYNHIVNEPLLSLINITRSVTYVTLLRKPVERILSLYSHYKRFNIFDIATSNINFETFIRRKLYYLNYQTLRVSGTDIPDLNRAKKNIVENFAVIGITEKYNEFLFLMKERFKWKDVKNRKLNQSISSVSGLIEHIPNELIDLINHDNQLDFELYTFTKQLLENKINLLSTLQKKELDNFLSLI